MVGDYKSKRVEELEGHQIINTTAVAHSPRKRTIASAGGVSIRRATAVVLDIVDSIPDLLHFN